MLTLDTLCDRIVVARRTPHRRLIAFAGPPASGKSTLADRACDALRARGHAAEVVPMDGFHLDNRLLDADGLRNTKGAPATFDAAGVLRLVRALQSDDEVIYPLFDRTRDIAIAGAGRVPADCDTVLVEGNYLLYDAPIWRDLAPLWSLSIALTPPLALLRTRLVARWLEHGLDPGAAALRADQNDMQNAQLIERHRLPADLEVEDWHDPVLR